MSEWCYGSCTIISQIGFVRGPLRDVAHREGCLPSPSFILLYFFFISSFGVKQTYNWHRLFFTLSLTLSLFCSLCVFVYVSHARPFSVNEQQQPRHAGKTKKIYKKMRLDSNSEFGVGVVVPRHGVIRIFFVVFSLSVCVLLTLCHPFYRSYDTFIYSYRPFGEKQTYA